MKEQNNNPDSSASCGTAFSKSVDLSANRKHTSIRVNSELWSWFVEWCQKSGVSSCSLIEGFILGLREAIKACASPRPTITVNLEERRVVERVRRRSVSYENRSEIVVETAGSSGRCVFCDRPSVCVLNMYSDDFHCVRTYVCGVHFEREKGKEMCRGYGYV